MQPLTFGVDYLANSHKSGAPASELPFGAVLGARVLHFWPVRVLRPSIVTILPAKGRHDRR